METNSEVQEIIKSKFLSPDKFSIDIERFVRDNKCNYIDGIIQYCQENEIEIETVSKLMSKPLKEKLKNNAIDLNFLKKTIKSKKVV
jgi:hypothetical protein